MQTWTRVSRAADELGLSTQAVRNLVRSGKLAGSKDPEGRWLIDVDSLSEYLSRHGRHKPASGVERIEERLDELTRSVASLSEASASATQLLELTERERDKHRAEAAAAKEAALLLVGSAREATSAVAGLLKSLQQQEEALVQLLAPGSPADLMPSSGRRT
jgi:chromosome segregation ATPase